MNRLLPISCLALAWLTQLSFAWELPPESKAELDRWQGAWRIVSSERGGKIEENAKDSPAVKFEGSKVLLGDKDVGLQITLLDAATTPRLLNITHAESKNTIEAIYEWKDDALRICLQTEGGGVRARPAGFDTKDQAQAVTVILKRSP